MPARVHALLVVRPDGRAPADLHLQRTLAALAAQSRPLDALTIVLCGTDAVLSRLAADSGAEGVITADRRTSFAEALSMASRRLDGDAVWLLAQDTAPTPDTLVRLAGALETAPSVAIAVPKLVRWDDESQIVSLGVSMTALGRTVPLVDGELDQGQHDAREDVMGADVRGLLVRTAAWQQLAGIDPALAGADEGLDLGVRARLRGDRVTVVPSAVIAVAGDGVAGVRVATGAWVRRAYAVRTAQLHRRLVYAPAAATVPHWLSLIPLALARTIGHLLAKRPGQIGPEWAAAATVGVRVGSIARARTGIRRSRRSGWAALAPLRVTSAELRQRFGPETAAAGPGRSDLHFFSGGGAWLVLTLLAVSLIAFTSLLAWPVLRGGALAALRATVLQLWADTLGGQRALGWATSGPADPFAAVVGAVGSLWPAAPSRAIVVLWILAMPLAALGGWFAATRVSERASVRAVGAVGWALAPMFLAALVEGRPTGVLVHLLLPWLFFTAAVAHRSWSAAGVASVVTVAVLACAPSMAPALILLWAVALVLTAVLRRGVGLGRVIWLLLPSAVVFAPLIWARVQAGDGWSLLADPGVPLAPDTATDLARRVFLAAGFPGTDAAGWAPLTGTPALWVVLLAAPLLLLALLAPAAGRVIPASVLLITALGGLATATLALGMIVSADGPVPVGLWPGTALSLYWIGVLGAALTTLDVWRVLAPARPVIAGALLLLFAVVAAPSVTAPLRGASALVEGTASTLPAYVAAEGRGGLGQGTFVITPTAGGAVIVDVVWGDTSALGGQTTLRSARTSADAADADAAELAAALVSDPGGDAVTRLAAHGVAFVMLGTGGPVDSDELGQRRIQTATSLDQRDDLEKVGETTKGMLWRVAVDVVDRTAPTREQADAARSAALQLGVIAVALLLAVPTRRSLAEGRRWPRIVGIGGGRSR